MGGKEYEFGFEWVQPIESHARLVMEWRNDPQTLKMSFHREPKEWESFFQEFCGEYFQACRLSPLFALLDGERVAFLRFSDCPHPSNPQRSCCEVGINLSPKFRGKGFGSSILKQAGALLAQKGYDDLYAEIRTENKASLKAFAKAGFEEIDWVRKKVEDTGEVCEIQRSLLHLKAPLWGREKVFIIAEAGSNWRMGTFERDLEMAKALIDVAVEAGADAVKFQTYRPEKVYVQNAGSSDYLSDSGIKQDIVSIFQDLSMPYEMLPLLAEDCRKKDIEFLSTPFSTEDFDAIDPFVSMHKIASYEISHLRLIEKAAQSQKPLILSTGASGLKDIDWAVQTFRKKGGRELCILQCTAKYPAESSSMNLAVIPQLQGRYSCSVGLSDHSRHPSDAPTTAVALGAKVIEKHYTLDNRLPGPDHGFAITPKELKEMVRSIRETEEMLGSPFKKVFAAEEELHSYARRGVQALCRISKGDVLREGENIDILRPGKQSMGVHPKYLFELEGKKALKEISLGQGIRKGDWG